jgi:hypothetical protein
MPIVVILVVSQGPLSLSLSLSHTHTHTHHRLRWRTGDDYPRFTPPRLAVALLLLPFQLVLNAGDKVRGILDKTRLFLYGLACFLRQHLSAPSTDLGKTATQIKNGSWPVGLSFVGQPTSEYIKTSTGGSGYLFKMLGERAIIMPPGTGTCGCMYMWIVDCVVAASCLPKRQP